jgi:hypothetical protein
MSKNVPVTWAQAFRDIVVEAIRKGQLLALAVASILIILVARMPPDKLFEVWQQIFSALHEEWFLSYILNLVLLLLMFYYTRRQRQYYEAEIERIAAERNQTQQNAGVKVKSSKG